MTNLPRTPAHFGSLAAALESGDREVIARTLSEMADEALELASKAPTENLWFLLMGLHESFYNRVVSA